MENTEQYQPVILELLEMWFKKKLFEVEDTYDKNKKHTAISYQYSWINTSISFNPEEKTYVWYLITTLGNSSNHIHLQIHNKQDLMKLLEILNLWKAGN